jgi:aminoglycoside phosphotransferase (APT) family kinase protein
MMGAGALPPDAKGPLIGRGARADVFAWGEAQALKLFWKGTNPSGVEGEARLTKMAYEAGLPVPAVAGVVTVDGRPGIIYQRIKGPTMLETVLAAPMRQSGPARRAAELHAQMHAIPAPGLPSQRDRLERNIQRAAVLPQRLRDAALAALARLPDGESLCHGDFHPGNIIIPESGGLERAVVIDWPDASRGSPVADVARTVLLGRHVPLHAPNRALGFCFRIIATRFLSAYLRRYAEFRPLPRSEFIAWQLPLAAARLIEGIREEERHLVALVEREAGRHSRRA